MVSLPPTRPDEPQGHDPPPPPPPGDAPRGDAPATADDGGGRPSRRARWIVAVVTAIVVVPVVIGAVANALHKEANPAPPGFAAALASRWQHGETLGATNVVTDTDRQDLCIVAGRIVGGPYDGEVAAWGVAPCSAVANPADVITIAANDVARSVNDLGSAASESAPIAEFRGDDAVQEAINGVPDSD